MAWPRPAASGRASATWRSGARCCWPAARPGRVLLKPATVEELFKPQTMVTAEAFYPTARLTKPKWTTYGLGWFQQDYRGRAAGLPHRQHRRHGGDPRAAARRARRRHRAGQSRSRRAAPRHHARRVRPLHRRRRGATGARICASCTMACRPRPRPSGARPRRDGSPGRRRRCRWRRMRGPIRIRCMAASSSRWRAIGCSPATVAPTRARSSTGTTTRSAPRGMRPGEGPQL